MPQLPRAPAAELSGLRHQQRRKHCHPSHPNVAVGYLIIPSNRSAAFVLDQIDTSTHYQHLPRNECRQF